MSRQNILLNSSNKGIITELNNDIELIFPSSIFYKYPNSLELLYFNLNSDISLFGNTNNNFKISLVNNSGDVDTYNVIVNFEASYVNDSDLATAVQTALNNLSITDASVVFTCNSTSIANIVTNYEIEQESYTTIYNITSTYPCSFYFNVKDSIGPIMGFGNGEYLDTTNVQGTSTQSITSYNIINSFNESGNDTSTFPNYNDLNCKIELYDSSNNLLQNQLNPGIDITISINSTVGNIFYDNMGQILFDIQTAMNEFSAYFTPHANFQVTFDYNNNTTTITNLTGAKFGIGFDFDKTSGLTTTGSLHSILGFQQTRYLGITTITSVTPSISFSNTFAEDYVLICSDLVNNNTDINVIGIGNGNNIKANSILYAIPLSLSSSFRPIDSSYYKIDISSSKFSLGYKTKSYDLSNPSKVNFYLRLLSGRHLKMNTQWSAILTVNYSSPVH